MYAHPLRLRTTLFRYSLRAVIQVRSTMLPAPAWHRAHRVRSRLMSALCLSAPLAGQIGRPRIHYRRHRQNVSSEDKRGFEASQNPYGLVNTNVRFVP
jgi:hypothetical protein